MLNILQYLRDLCTVVFYIFRVSTTFEIIRQYETLRILRQQIAIAPYFFLEKNNSLWIKMYAFQIRHEIALLCKKIMNFNFLRSGKKMRIINYFFAHPKKIWHKFEA